jgi:hypothetical protein
VGITGHEERALKAGIAESLAECFDINQRREIMVITTPP